MTIDVVLEDARWAELDLEALSDAAATATLAQQDLEAKDWEISLLACDDTRIAALNADFRGKENATNVLSWPSEERAPDTPGEAPAPPDPAFGPELGDIAISFDSCDREAEAAGIPLPDHATHLVVHAILHLLGYDHETDEDATLMEGIEVEILAKLGVPDPY